jgi:hypothetical protein
MNIHIALDTVDLWQILDALEIRAEAYEETERFLTTGEFSDDVITQDCQHPKGANQIASHYRSIIATIRQQLARGAKS